ncbi:MBG domain-containing protein [Pedobacter sp. CFBP9032]|uniref:MBG domain-containing protein n=1 Tax=Pedobacter sp. CFBP9032 TaxID=3096539 RepID=UPI002A6A3F38|nr:MBG domain-containing protein [Pedobacter sp. CFBP9032]MDY0906408.1 MBG domain-containing protein [Pedobacter sp. CFBP9032]
MKKNFTLIFTMLLCFFSIGTMAQTQFWSDTFEDTGAPSSGTRAPSIDIGGPSVPYAYYFLRTNGTNLNLNAPFAPETNTSYQNIQGTKFWAGEDTDRARTGSNVTTDKVQTITWSNINISGKTGLSFKGLFAALQSQGWQNPDFGAAYDFLMVEYSIDGGAWTKAGGFYGDRSAINAGYLREDTDNDNFGDGALLSRTFTDFTWAITGTGSTMSLRFSASADAGSTQEFAIDNFRLFDAPVSVAPTVTTGSATGIGAVKATLGGNVTADGGPTVSDRGIVWATTINPTISNTKVSSGTGTGIFSAIVSSLPAGTLIHYRAFATNSVGTSYGSDVTFTTNAALSGTISKTDVSCFGGSNGTATVSITGGAVPYSYLWSPAGGTGSTASGLSPGNYTCTIRDNESTEITRNITINQPASAVSGTTVVTNIACFSGTNGSINLTPTGGTAPYTFNWGGGITTEDRTGLAAGTYTVTITDANGCTSSVSATVTQPASGVSGTRVITNVSCFSGTNGSINLTPTGGTAPYTFNWGGGITTEDRTGLAPGTYSVTITDVNGCTGVVSATVTQPTAISGSTVVTNIACSGGTTGSINLTPTGGTAPYTFSWGGGITTEDRTGLAAGNYSVTITDANGCTGVVSATITQPASAVSGTTVVTNIACFSGTNGSINLTPTGGTAPYTFNWGGGITTEDRTGLAAGTYTVIITDANGCSGTVSATVTQPASGVSGTTVVTNIACLGGSNGAINLTPTGGTAPYTFNWGGGITTEDRTGLAAGTYTVTITDANGCTSSVSATVTQPASGVSGTRVITNIACFGGTNGSINLTPTGGTAPYTFNWGGGITTEDRTGLAAGTYTVIITDINGCTGVVSATINQPALAISGTTVVTNIACFGGTNGSINLTPAGGTGPYTFNWGGGITTEDRTGLATGTYTVIITDANGCTGSVSATVTQPASGVSGTRVVTNVACFGGTNGSINLTPTGGTVPYTFNWGGGITTEDRTGLAAGNYTVIITDANGCTGVVPISITAPSAIVTTASAQTNVSCFGGTNGSATVSATGGTGAFTYSWSPSGGTAATATALAAGTYTVTVTDANGCTATRTFTITAPAAIVTTASAQTNVACFGGTNGSATVLATGGTGPYTYSWSPSGGTAATATGLAAGTYTVTVTDANGCTATRSFTITAPAAIATMASAQTNIACFGGTNGSATVSATGGTGPYTYSWSPSGGTAATATGLAAGTYTVTVTDANGCTATRAFTITAPPAIVTVASAQTNVACFGGTNGSATVSATGGTGPYTYSWSPSGGTAATATGLAAGTYTVTVTDANGCTATRAFTITAPAAIVATAGIQTNVLCNGGSTGSATVNVTGGTGAYTYSWSPSGGTAATATGLAAGTYIVTVTDANLCQTTQSFTITQPAALGITTNSFSQAQVTMPYMQTLSAIGGNGTYTYGVTTGNLPTGLTLSSSGNISGTPTATGTFNFTITVTESGCGQTTSKAFTIVSVSSTQTITFTALPTQTFGNSPLTLTATANSGLPLVYASSNTSVATISGNVLTITGAGTADITASQAGGSGYDPAPDVVQTLTVNKANATITLGNLTQVFDGTQKSVTVTTTPAGLTGLSTTYNGLATAPTAAGTYTVSSTLNNNNYAATVATGNLVISPQAITVTAAAKSKTYGDADPALTYTFTPTLIGTDTFTGSLSRSPGENVGTYAINQGTLALNGNYSLTYVGANLTIGAKTVTVTAAAKNKTYGDADPALTYTFTPTLAGTDTFTGSLTRSPGENVGTYAINQGTLALNGNYTLTYVGADLTIGAKTVTVTAAAKSKTYGDADPAQTYTFAPALTGTDTFTGSLTRSPGENVGTYAINQGTLALNGNYTLTYVGANLTIGAKTITVTAAAKSKTYGDADPALTYTSAPALVTGDSFSGSLTRAVGENVGTYAINQGTLALNGNYTLTYIGADLTIGAKTVTVTAVAKSKTYGDADPALTYTFAPALTGTDTFTGSLTRSPGENVGTYTINQGTLALNGNYSLTYVGANLTISAKTITVTAASKSKNYGDADPALTYTFAPALTGTDTFTGSLTRSPGENVGTYAINQGTLALNGNYSLTYVGANLTIGAKTITVTAAAKSKTFGDVDPALTYTFAPALQTGDAFTGSLTRLPGENVGTYGINQGTLALSSNYVLTYAGANLTIGAKTITVTAVAKSKTFGDVDPALTYTFAPALATGDSFSGSLTRLPGENVGTYAINQGTLALSSNYVLTYAGANLTIGAKIITVTAAAKSKTFADVDPALTYTFAPALATGDAFTGSLTRAVGENVGTYAINQGTLALSNNYTLTYVGANLTIGAKTITVTAAAKSKTFGDADPALTYTFAPALQTGDAFTGSLTRLPGENVGTYSINQGTLALNGNYSLTYVGANLTIGAKTITVTAAAKSKTFGDVDPALTYTFAPALATGDSFSGSLNRLPGEAVGTYAITQGTLALNRNYTLTYNGANLTITSRVITITAIAKSKTYGDADPALTYTFSPALPTGTVVTGSLTRAAGENAGTYAINQGSLTLSGNYTVAYAGADLTINKAVLTVSANNAVMCQSDGFPNFGVAYNGFKAGDTENSLSTKPTVSTTANSNVAGTYVLVASNGGSGNYTFVYVNGSLVINALPQVNILSNNGTSISKGETAILTASGGSSYSWSTASGIISGQNTASLTVRPSQTTVYTVRVTNASGCSRVESITIQVAEDYKIVANNILTPNGDGVNDTWIVKNIDMYPGNEVRIFDRNGREMYSKKSYDNSWDGTLRGIPLAEGTYYYIITYGPDKLVQKGFITIIRNR